MSIIITSLARLQAQRNKILVAMIRYLLFAVWFSLTGTASGSLGHDLGERRSTVFRVEDESNIETKSFAHHGGNMNTIARLLGDSDDISSDDISSDDISSDDDDDYSKVMRAFANYDKEAKKNNVDKAKQKLHQVEVELSKAQAHLNKKKEQVLEKKKKLDEKKAGIDKAKKAARKKEDQLSKKKEKLKNNNKRKLTVRELATTLEKELMEVEKDLVDVIKETMELDEEETKLAKEFEKVDKELEKVNKSQEVLDTMKSKIDAAKSYSSSKTSQGKEEINETGPTIGQGAEGGIESTDNAVTYTGGEQGKDTARDRLPNDGNRISGPKALSEGTSPQASNVPVEGEEADEFDFFVGLTPHLEHCQPTELDNLDQVMTAIMRIGFMDIDIYFYEFEEEQSPVRRLMGNETERELQTTTRRTNRYGYTGHACRRCRNGRKKTRRSTGKRKLFETIDEVGDPLDYENIATRMSEAIKITVVETFATDPISCLGRGRPPEISVQLMVPV